MVSTIHDFETTVLKRRKRPRKTKTNSMHINSVWGDNYETDINIPECIDDYNRWMGGVDLSDQFISYYRPEIRCRRTWIPHMLHALNIARVNAYVALKALWDKPDLPSHKEFVMLWISELLNKAVIADLPKAPLTRRQSSEILLTTKQHLPKRPRVSKLWPALEPCRKIGDPTSHTAVVGLKQRKCRYCCTKAALFKKDNASAASSHCPKIKRVRRGCNVCNVNLCKEHFELYHLE